MASEAMIKDMIISFCDFYGKMRSESLEKSWHQALSKYDDQDVARAGQKAIEECNRMPVPADIVGRIIKQEQQIEDFKYRLISGKCGLCGHIGLCILEDPYSDMPRCRQCYTGLTLEQHKAKMNAIIEALNGKNATY